MTTTRPCPYCGKPVQWEKSRWRPFCSERCKRIDLGFWAMGDYRIAFEEISSQGEPPPLDEGQNTKK